MGLREHFSLEINMNVLKKKEKKKEMVAFIKTV